MEAGGFFQVGWTAATSESWSGFFFFRASLPAYIQFPEQQGTSPAHSVSRGEALENPLPLIFYFFLFHGSSSGFQRVNTVYTVYCI